MDRLTQLADRYGAYTGPGADWSEPLLKEARKEFNARTSGGKRSYGQQYGKDIITAAEIVSQVFVRWAAKPEVTVEWFDTLEGKNATAKMLRTYCIHAADDVLQLSIEYRRIEGVSVTSMEMAESGSVTEGNDEDTDGWILNMPEMLTNSAEEDYFEQDSAATYLELLERMETISQEIIAAVTSDTYRKAISAHVLDGLLHKEIEERYGIGAKTSASAYKRGVQDAGDIACLMVWRNITHRGMNTGTATKAALAVTTPPTKFLEAAEALGIDTAEVLERFVA